MVILFFSRSRAQVEPSHPFLRWMAQMTCFRPRKCLLGVRMMGDVIWGKYTPKKTPEKGAWIGSFKPKRQNLYIAISPEPLNRRTSDLRSEFIPRKALRGWSAITPKRIQHGWRPPSWKIDMMSYFSGGCSDLDEIRQSDAEWHADYGKWSRSKPEVKFQYGGRLYFETGSSYISSANGAILKKFGLLTLTLTFWRQWHQQIQNRK